MECVVVDLAMDTKKTRPQIGKKREDLKVRIMLKLKAVADFEMMDMYTCTTGFTQSQETTQVIQSFLLERIREAC